MAEQHYRDYVLIPWSNAYIGLSVQTGLNIGLEVFNCECDTNINAVVYLVRMRWYYKLMAENNISLIQLSFYPYMEEVLMYSY